MVDKRLGNAVRTSNHHPGYNATLSISENIHKGHAYWEHKTKYPYLEVECETLALANLQENISPHSSAHFRAVAREAGRLHRQRECKGNCRHR